MLNFHEFWQRVDVYIRNIKHILGVYFIFEYELYDQFRDLVTVFLLDRLGDVIDIEDQFVVVAAFILLFLVNIPENCIMLNLFLT